MNHNFVKNTNICVLFLFEFLIFNNLVEVRYSLQCKEKEICLSKPCCRTTSVNFRYFLVKFSYNAYQKLTYSKNELFHIATLLDLQVFSPLQCKKSFL